MNALEHCELVISSIIKNQQNDDNLANAIHEIFSTLRKHTYFKDENKKKFIHHATYYKEDISVLPENHTANEIINKISHRLYNNYKANK